MPLRILIAPDKFKHSLTAPQVCKAIEDGLLQQFPDAVIQSIPLADGGEGTADVLTFLSRGKEEQVTVMDPLMRPVRAGYGLSSDGSTAFIETASASGLQRLQPHERSPIITSTFGTGEIIRHAIEKGVGKLMIGVGGTATNEGGAGLASALGYSFVDESGKQLEPTGRNLIHIRRIETDGVPHIIKHCEVVVLCDVRNPLTGPNGATYTYALQKGATADDLFLLEEGLKHLALRIREDLGVDIENLPGAGAGGGSAGGLVAFLGGTLVRGIDALIELSKLEAHVKNADVVITGEGKLDSQTVMGKVIQGVASCCNKYNKPLFAIVGKNELTDYSQVLPGLTDVFELTSVTEEEDSIRNAYRWLSHLASTRLADRLRSHRYIKS